MGQYTDINSAIAPVQGGQVPLSSYIGPGDIDLDSYPTHLSNFQLGGLHTVNAPGDMVLMPPEFRSEGMICYVQSERNYYRLEQDLVTWVLLLQGNKSVANIIRRPFQNELQLVFNDIPAEPLIQIYEDAAPIFRPALYSDLDTLLYGLSEYNQSNVPTKQGVSWELADPDYIVSFLPTQLQLQVNFLAPRSGTAVITF